jgi:hypothetical protein
MKGEHESRRLVSLLGYLLVLGLGAILIGWIVARMTRTEEADYLIIRMAAALGVAGLVLLVTLSLGRRH